MADVVRHWIAQPDVAPGAFNRYIDRLNEQNSSGLSAPSLLGGIVAPIGRPKAKPGSLLKKR